MKSRRSFFQSLAAIIGVVPAAAVAKALPAEDRRVKIIAMGRTIPAPFPRNEKFIWVTVSGGGGGGYAGGAVGGPWSCGGGGDGAA